MPTMHPKYPQDKVEAFSPVCLASIFQVYVTFHVVGMELLSTCCANGFVPKALVKLWEAFAGAGEEMPFWNADSCQKN